MNDLTPRAQQLLALARKEAERFQHNYIGTEHLLLGLIKLGQGNGIRILQQSGLALETICLETEKEMGTPSTKNGVEGTIPYTPRVKKILTYAAREARVLEDHCVGTEHILLGLIYETEGVATHVLKDLDLTYEKTKEIFLTKVRGTTESQDVDPEVNWKSLYEQEKALRLEAYEKLKALKRTLENMKQSICTAFTALDKVESIRGKQ